MEKTLVIMLSAELIQLVAFVQTVSQVVDAFSFIHRFEKREWTVLILCERLYIIIIMIVIIYRRNYTVRDILYRRNYTVRDILYRSNYTVKDIIYRSNYTVRDIIYRSNYTVRYIIYRNSHT